MSPPRSKRSLVPLAAVNIVIEACAHMADLDRAFATWAELEQLELTPDALALAEVARGRVATVAVQGMSFLTPVHVGAVVSCYCDILDIGRSSVRVLIEVWINSQHDGDPIKVTEGEFIYVAIDNAKRTRTIGQ